MGEKINPIIPSLFHQVWLWWKALPENFQKYQRTWIDLHPAWTLKVWNEDTIKQLQNVDYSDLEKLNSYAEKSDYLRFCIILEYWGVYIDTDFECLQAIDSKIQDEIFFIAPDWHYINNAIFGAVKNCPIVKKIFYSFHERLRIIKNEDPVHKIWPGYINKFRNEIIVLGWSILPKEYFYYFDWKTYHKSMYIDRQELLLKWSYAIHHYSFSWKEKSLLRELREYLTKFIFFRKIYQDIYLRIKYRNYK